MSIHRENGELVASCDDCGHEYYGGTLDFSDFIRELKNEEWRIVKDGDQWRHFCTDCTAGEYQ